MLRSPLTTEPPLLDVERALRLANDARAFLSEREVWKDAEGAPLARWVALDAALVALDVALDARDPHLLHAVLELAEEAADRWDDEPFHPDLSLANAAEKILPEVRAITESVEACAASPSDFVRLATARGLAPRAIRSLRGEGDAVDRDAARVVLGLLEDGTYWVRAETRKALGEVAPPAWVAFFDRDPLASRSAAEAARLRGPLDRAAEALETLSERDARPLAGAIAELPDALAAPILESFVRGAFLLGHQGADALLERWVGLDAEGARVVAWLAREDGRKDKQDGERIGAAIRTLPPERAAAIALRVARFIHGLDFPSDTTALGGATAVLAAAWPDEVDPSPLLELVLDAELDRAAALDAAPLGMLREIPRDGILRVALAPRPAFALTLDRLVDFFLRGFPGRWDRVRDAVTERLVEARHSRLRAHAEAMLREGDAEAAGWALRHLIAGGHDPESDPEPEAILAAACADPRLRAAVVANHALCKRAREPLRAHLIAGGLTPPDALELARSMDGPDGVPVLEPDEWAAVRQAREALVEVDHRALALHALPPLEGWIEADHRFVERLFEEHGAAELVTSVAISALGRRAGPELVPLLERLLERARPEATEDVRRCLDRCRGEEDEWTSD